MTNEATATQYKFRELTSKDIFPMCKLIKKIGVMKLKSAFDSVDVKNAVSKTKGKKATDEAMSNLGVTVMFEIVGIILEDLPNCEKEIYDFLASVSDVEQADIEKMSIATFAQMIIDFIKKPEFKDFFKVVSASLR